MNSFHFPVLLVAFPATAVLQSPHRFDKNAPCHGPDKSFVEIISNTHLTYPNNRAIIPISIMANVPALNTRITFLSSLSAFIALSILSANTPINIASIKSHQYHFILSSI